MAATRLPPSGQRGGISQRNARGRWALKSAAGCSPSPAHASHPRSSSGTASCLLGLTRENTPRLPPPDPRPRRERPGLVPLSLRSNNTHLGPCVLRCAQLLHRPPLSATVPPPQP